MPINADSTAVIKSEVKLPTAVARVSPSRLKLFAKVRTRSFDKLARMRVPTFVTPPPLETKIVK